MHVPMHVLMHVLIGEHPQQLLLLGVVESAGVGPFLGVFIRSEDHVPPRDVAIVVFVPTVLMMYPMHFRPPEEVADPVRCSDTGVVEKFPDGRAQRVDAANRRQ